jgi:hypothetical protein
MLVVAPIVILVISGFIVAIVTLTGEALVANARNALTYNVQATLARIDNDARRSAGFLATNSFVPVSPQGVDDSTESFENATAEGGALILRMFATTGNPQDPASNVAVLKNSPYVCGESSSSGNTPLIFNVVYFVRDNALWRRAMMPVAYDTIGCSVPWQLPSCTPGHSSGFCGTNDELMMEGVAPEDFNLSYFSSSSSATPVEVASDAAETTSARSGALGSALAVRVDIDAGRMIAGTQITENGHARINRSYANITPEYFE